MTRLKDNVLAVEQLIRPLAQSGKRCIVAIAGPPGSGKSTLAEAVVERINQSSPSKDCAALLPMDGFHLDNDTLAKRNLLSRKGSPATFDTQSLRQLLEKVRAHHQSVHYPIFDRVQDCAIADAGTLRVETPIVVVEGNYLLLEDTDWKPLQGYFDATVFIKPAMSVLETRLMDRWLNLGYSKEAAAAKTHGNDLVNASLVLENSRAAHLVLT
jgi:pantothenate kinase